MNVPSREKYNISLIYNFGFSFINYHTEINVKPLINPSPEFSLVYLNKTSKCDVLTFNVTEM